MIAIHNTAESYWFGVLTETERKHYERCIHAIMVYYSTRPTSQFDTFMTHAKRLAITSDVVRAILWRIQQELDDND